MINLNQNKQIKTELELFLKSNKKGFDLKKVESLFLITKVEQIPVKYISRLADKLEKNKDYLDEKTLYLSISLLQRLSMETMVYNNIAMCRYDKSCELNLDKVDVKQAKKAYNQSKELLLQDSSFDNIRDYITKAKILYFAEPRNIMYKSRVLDDIALPEIHTSISYLMKRSLPSGGHIDAQFLNILESTLTKRDDLDLYLSLIQLMRQYLGKATNDLQYSYNKVLGLVVDFSKTHEVK